MMLAMACSRRRSCRRGACADANCTATCSQQKKCEAQARHWMYPWSNYDAPRRYGNTTGRNRRGDQAALAQAQL